MTKEGKEFTIKVMNHMKNKLETYKEEDGQEYNLEATPAEGVTRRFAAEDKKKYSDIIVANNENYEKYKAAPYYTNSTQVSVDSKKSLFKILDNQNDIQTIYNGGTVFHIFLGEHKANGESVKQLIKKIFTNYALPYVSITPSFSICPLHGYLSGAHNYCPKCLTSDDIIPKK